MIIADFFNSLFELCGALFVFFSIRDTLKHKSATGISIITVTFFTIWGYWNLFYYPSLEQWLSATGAVLLALTNTVWFSLILYFKGYLNWLPGLKK